MEVGGQDQWLTVTPPSFPDSTDAGPFQAVIAWTKKVVLMQNGEPTHTTEATQDLLMAPRDEGSFWPKEMLRWMGLV